MPQRVIVHGSMLKSSGVRWRQRSASDKNDRERNGTAARRTDGAPAECQALELWARNVRSMTQCVCLISLHLSSWKWRDVWFYLLFWTHSFKAEMWALLRSWCHDLFFLQHKIQQLWSVKEMFDQHFLCMKFIYSFKSFQLSYKNVI